MPSRYLPGSAAMYRPMNSTMITPAIAPNTEEMIGKRNFVAPRNSLLSCADKPPCFCCCCCCCCGCSCCCGCCCCCCCCCRVCGFAPCFCCCGTWRPSAFEAPDDPTFCSI